MRRQAAVDGQAIDPWHLAAVLEGLRLRMDHALRIIDRGVIFEAARHALDLHQWLVAPDFDQEGEVQRAETGPGAAAASGATRCSPPPPACTPGSAGGAPGRRAARRRQRRRPPPIRAALVRFWAAASAARAGAADRDRALRADGAWQRDAWMPVVPQRAGRRSRPTRWSCCSTWSAPGSPRAAPLPGGGGIRAPPPRWISWPPRR